MATKARLRWRCPCASCRLLKELYLWDCGVGDEGVGSLMANLGKDDFKVLERLSLYKHELTSDGIATTATHTTSDNFTD